MSLGGDAAVWRDGFHQPHVAADHRMSADDRLAPENGGTGIDGHVVLDGRMPLRAATHLGVALEAERTERDPLVDLHVIPDDRRLADHDPRAVVDEERLADSCPGMDADHGARWRVVRH